MAASDDTPCPPTPAISRFHASPCTSGRVGSGGAASDATTWCFGRLRADQRDEGRAEAAQAGHVLVAGGLVDLPLAAELGLDRLDRQAVRGARAIAAILADARVDHHAALGLRRQVALALAAAFGGAFLVVDDGGDALHLAQAGAARRRGRRDDGSRHRRGSADCRDDGRGRRRRSRCARHLRREAVLRCAARRSRLRASGRRSSRRRC